MFLKKFSRPLSKICLPFAPPTPHCCTLPLSPAVSCLRTSFVCCLALSAALLCLLPCLVCFFVGQHSFVPKGSTVSFLRAPLFPSGFAVFSLSKSCLLSCLVLSCLALSRLVSLVISNRAIACTKGSTLGQHSFVPKGSTFSFLRAALFRS
jgi:hypothetical protein